MELLSSSIEQFPKRDALEAATRKISKIKEFADTLLFLSHQCKFWSNFTEIRQSTYPINSFKQEELFRKTNASFRPPMICKHGTPYQRDMSTRKAVSQRNDGTPGVHRKQTRTSRESYFLHAGFSALVINGENKNKAILEEKQKEIEELVPTRDCKEALVKIGSPG